MIQSIQNYWEVEARIVTDDITTATIAGLDYGVGDTARFQSNAHPEAHQEGSILYALLRYILYVV